MYLTDVEGSAWQSSFILSYKSASAQFNIAVSNLVTCLKKKSSLSHGVAKDVESVSGWAYTTEKLTFCSRVYLQVSSQRKRIPVNLLVAKRRMNMCVSVSAYQKT